jgi:hypothetical protein
MSRQDTAQALADGAQAGRDGRPPTDCPHPAGSVLRAAWVRGYAKQRPIAARRGEDT